jgi:Domain of unknown function (DUF4389)
MVTATVYAANVTFDADRHIARWRPLVQLILAVPQLIVARVLSSLRGILTLMSAVSVLFTAGIPRPLFDAIAMTYRYEWRALSYALFLHDDYPPFEFNPSADDDGHEAHTTLTIAYPERLNRWKPLYKWFLAIPHYVVCLALAVASIPTVVWGLIAVVATGEYPGRARRFLVGSYRYGLRVQAYAGMLTDQYPPFHLHA